MADPFINAQGWTITGWEPDETTSKLPEEDFWLGSSLSIGSMGPFGLTGPTLYAMSLFSPQYSWLCQVSGLQLNPAIEHLYGYGPVGFPDRYIFVTWGLEIEPDGSLQCRLIVPGLPDFPDGGGGTFTATANPTPPLPLPSMK